VANVTKTTAAEFLQTIWSGYILHAYKNRLGVTDRINRRLEDDAKFAAVINVNKISHLTVGDKSQVGADVAYEAITETKVQVSINKWKYVAFRIDDIVRLQTRADLRQEYTNEIGYGLKRVQNTDITALFAGFSFSIGTLGQQLTEADRAAAMQKFWELDVDTENSDNITWFLSPAENVAWLKEEEIKNSLYMGSTQALREANIPSLYGAPLWQSNVITANGAGHDNALVHRDAVTLIQQLAPRVKSEWVIENISQAVVADTIYGVGELRDEGGIWLKGL
jgi:hypothetical protein